MNSQRRARRWLSVTVLAVLAGAAVSAHHPFGNYHLDRDITISGEVVRWSFGEPHSFLHLRHRDEGGQEVTWIVELRGAGRLKAQGITPRTVAAGERVTVMGSPGRVNAERRLLMKTMIRARDGAKWGSS